MVGAVRARWPQGRSQPSSGLAAGSRGTDPAARQNALQPDQERYSFDSVARRLLCWLASYSPPKVWKRGGA